MAALALIRRGVPNIIIIDSEHDPHHKFKGYTDLIDTLDEIGIKFNIKEIDDILKKGLSPTCPLVNPKAGKGKKVFSCSAIAEGDATSKGEIPKGGDRPVKSKIYYLKMSNPNMISFRRFLDDEKFQDSHKALKGGAPEGFRLCERKRGATKTRV